MSRSNTSRHSGLSLDLNAERPMRRDLDSSVASSTYSTSSRRSPPPVPNSPGAEMPPELPPRKGPTKDRPIPRERGVYKKPISHDDDQATVPSTHTIPQGRNPRESMLADNSFLSGNVIALNDQNFEFYITPKEKAIIYFYDSSKGRNNALQNSFSDRNISAQPMPRGNRFRYSNSPHDAKREVVMRSDGTGSQSSSVSSFTQAPRLAPTIPSTPSLYSITPKTPPSELPPKMRSRRNALSPSLGPQRPARYSMEVPETALQNQRDICHRYSMPPNLFRNESMKTDCSFLSQKVMSLNEDNFEDFIAPKEKALIYFYNGCSGRNHRFENTFSVTLPRKFGFLILMKPQHRGAHARETFKELSPITHLLGVTSGGLNGPVLMLTTTDLLLNPNYGFGAVDCSCDRCLCNYYQVSQTPALKLFSNGFLVSSINKPDTLSANQMQQLMKMTPVLTQPREEIGKKFMQKTVARKAVKKRFFLFK